MTSRTTDLGFARAWVENGFSPTEVAKSLGIHVRNVLARRNRLEAKGYVLPSFSENLTPYDTAYKLREELEIDDAVMVVVSDRHKWPGDGVSAAEAALYTLLPQIKPNVFVFNGDLFDGANISRHPPLGWEKKPDAASELFACQQVLSNIEQLVGKDCGLYYTIGNHCRRFDYKLALTASDFRGITGLRLADHFAHWRMSWSLHVNPGVLGGHTVIKHKLRQGVGAARNNALASGVHIVTGHTHALTVTPIEDYRGRRYGVECGFLSHKKHAAFEYAEDGPSYSRPGFAVLTWRNGVLLPPELVEVDDSGVAWFRGDAVAVSKPKYRVKAVYERI